MKEVNTRRTALILGAVIMLLSPIRTEARTQVDEETPLEIQALCDEYGSMYDICPELLEAIIYRESRYTADIENGPCKGLMQLNEPYYKDRMEQFGITDIKDPESNIHLGADYLAELFEEYKDPAVVLGVYHGEKNAQAKALNNQLSNYTKSILKKSEELERLHGK